MTRRGPSRASRHHGGGSIPGAPGTISLPHADDERNVALSAMADESFRTPTTVYREDGTTVDVTMLVLDVENGGLLLGDLRDLDGQPVALLGGDTLELPLVSKDF